MRLLLVTSQSEIQHRIAAAFAPAEAVVDVASDAEEAVDIDRVPGGYDLVVLVDDGLETLRRLRSAGLVTPLIWLARTSTLADRIRALDLGADDCLALDIDAGELLARSRGIVRRGRGHAAAVLRIGDLEIDTAARTVRFAGLRLRITGKEFGILELLALRGGEVVSRDVIMDHLYGGPDEPVAKVIDIHVCRIRRKLAEAASGETPLHTVWGRGFMLAASAAAVAPMAA